MAAVVWREIVGRLISKRTAVLLNAHNLKIDRDTDNRPDAWAVELSGQHTEIKRHPVVELIITADQSLEFSLLQLKVAGNGAG